MADGEPRRAWQVRASVSGSYWAAGLLRVLEGDWAKARSLIEHAIAVARAGNFSLILPLVVAASAWVLAQLGEASEATSQLREGEELLERYAAAGHISNLAWVCHLLGRACLLSVGSTRPDAWATARSSPHRVTPASLRMRCTCSATSRPIPTALTPKAPRPSTVRRWRSPSHGVCVPS